MGERDSFEDYLENADEYEDPDGPDQYDVLWWQVVEAPELLTDAQNQEMMDDQQKLLDWSSPED